MKRVVYATTGYTLSEDDIEYIQTNVENMVYQVYENYGHVDPDIVMEHLSEVSFDPEYAEDHEVDPLLIEAFVNKDPAVMAFINKCLSDELAVY